MNRKGFELKTTILYAWFQFKQEPSTLVQNNFCDKQKQDSCVKTTGLPNFDTFFELHIKYTLFCQYVTPNVYINFGCSCAQCFRPFQDGVFYEFEGRKYCEHDFQVLFAPCCGKCGKFVIGRVIKAMNANWHPTCFCCEMCNVELADSGFIRNAGRALCHECNAKVKAVGLGKYVCHKCQ